MSHLLVPQTSLTGKRTPEKCLSPTSKDARAPPPPVGPCPHLRSVKPSAHSWLLKGSGDARERDQRPRPEALTWKGRARGLRPEAQAMPDLIGGPAQDSEGDTGESSQNSPTAGTRGRRPGRGWPCGNF